MERLQRNDHMVFMRSGQDCFVLTYSERPIDPNAGNAHDIHHAFRVTALDYERAKIFLAERGHCHLQGRRSAVRNVQGRSAYFHDPRPKRA